MELPSDVKRPKQTSFVLWGFSGWLVIGAIAFSFVAPIITSFVVINSLIGIANLKRQYWLVDGLILSLVLNGIFMSPLLTEKGRSVARIYVPCVAVIVTLIAYWTYEYWMVALMGV